MTRQHVQDCIDRWEKMLCQAPSRATTQRLRKAIQIAAEALREDNPERRATLLWNAESVYRWGDSQ